MKFTTNKVTGVQPVKDYLDKLKTDREYDIEIKLHRTTRTLNQNSLYWLWVGIISDDTGNDKETIHQFFTQKFIGFSKSSLYGEDIFSLPTTTKLNTTQFTKYLEQIEAWVNAELGIILPSPEDAILADLASRYL